jgi:ribonuclease D
LCARLAKADFVTVDTEFMRENTFWPELCLVQIADDKEAAAIDPLAPASI